MSYFIPHADGDKKSWTANFKLKIATLGVTLGLTPLQIGEEQAACDAINVAIDNKVTKKAEFAAAVANQKSVVKSKQDFLRTRINQIKTNSAYTTAIGTELRILDSGENFDEHTYTPVLQGEARKGDNRIFFEKQFRVIDGVNIYRRKKGTTDWGNKYAFDNNSPYDDYAVAQGETNEYMAIGVVDDVEVGLPSEIVELTAI